MRPDRQLLAMAAYGFVSGLPLPLSGFTFRLWLSDSGAALTVVGLTAWIGLAYSLKFLWAPLLDQAPPVAALHRLGRPHIQERVGAKRLFNGCIAACRHQTLASYLPLTIRNHSERIR